MNGVKYVKDFLSWFRFKEKIDSADLNNKKIPGHVNFKWKENGDCLCVHQMKFISVKRVLGRLGKVSDLKLKSVKDEIKKFYGF